MKTHDNIRPLLGLTTFFTLNPAHATGINDTGITTCSNETENGLACPVTGFPGQDAEYGTNLIIK
jgi:hypothetical protein